MEDKIIKLLKEIIPTDRVNEIEFSGETDIINEVGLDSLGMINFILRLEEESGVSINIVDLELSHLSSINNLCKFLVS